MTQAGSHFSTLYPADRVGAAPPASAANAPFPTWRRGDVPVVAVATLIGARRIATQAMRLGPARLVENAGAALATLVRVAYRPESCCVMVGPRVNGAAGLVAARHLENAGVAVTVVLGADLPEMSGEATEQLQVCERMGIPVTSRPGAGAVVVDALVGHGLEGAPRGRIETLVRWANARPRPIVSLAIPTGVSADDGAACDPAIRADATLALGLPTTGLLGSERAGTLYLADVSLPRLALRMVGVTAPRTLFAAGPIVRLT